MANLKIGDKIKVAGNNMEFLDGLVGVIGDDLGNGQYRCDFNAHGNKEYWHGIHNEADISKTTKKAEDNEGFVAE